MSVTFVLPQRDEDDVSKGLRQLTAALIRALPDADAGFGLGGENGYGVDFENDVFEMRRFYWGDCDCGADETDAPHTPTCAIELPNFRHKASGYTVRWYKWIGRGMEIEGEADFGQILRDCLSSIRGDAT